jgi:hypothetical protein
MHSCFPPPIAAGRRFPAPSLTRRLLPSRFLAEFSYQAITQMYGPQDCSFVGNYFALGALVFALC